MNIGATMVRKRVVDRDTYQQETKPWPWWKMILGSLAVAAALIFAAVVIAVFS